MKNNLDDSIIHQPTADSKSDSSSPTRAEVFSDKIHKRIQREVELKKLIKR